MIAASTSTELPAKVIGMTDGFAVIEVQSVGAYHWPKSHLPENVAIGSELLVGVRSPSAQNTTIKSNSDFETMRRALEDLIN